MSKVLKSETVLPDDYPVYLEYVYIADLKIIRSDLQGTVADLKIETGAKEIRRCDLFAKERETSKIGDVLKVNLMNNQSNDLAVMENKDGERYVVCHVCEKEVKRKLVDRVSINSLSDKFCASCHDLMKDTDNVLEERLCQTERCLR